MRWEDERYVRIYTRDTPDWLCLSFLAQGLFCLILRKVDRAGLLKLGKHGKRAVAIVVGFPGDWSRLEPALEELLADGCVQIRGEYLVVPNFIEAQEAPQSDAQRKRESRAKARDVAAAAAVLNPDNSSEYVTHSHETGQKVTSGHVASQVVTPNCAVPCRAEPSEETPPPARAREAGGSSLAPGAVEAAPPPAAEAAPEAEVSPDAQAQGEQGHMRSGDNPGQHADGGGAVPGRAAPPPAADPPPTGRLSPLPSRAERLAQRFPSTGELLRELDAGGWQASYATDDVGRGAIERAVALVGVQEAARRLLAHVEAERAAGREPRPWLGWHLAVISPTAPQRDVRVGMADPGKPEDFEEGEHELRM